MRYGSESGCYGREEKQIDMTQKLGNEKKGQGWQSDHHGRSQHLLKMTSSLSSHFYRKFSPSGALEIVPTLIISPNNNLSCFSTISFVLNKIPPANILAFPSSSPWNKSHVSQQSKQDNLQPKPEFQQPA